MLFGKKKTNLGGLLCLAPNPDEPFVFSAGGDNKSHNLKIFDLLRISEIHERFQNRVPKINIDDIKTEIKEEIMDVTENMDSMILNPNTENKMT